MGERTADRLSRPVQPGSDRPDGDAEHFGDPVERQVEVVVEDHHCPVVDGKPADLSDPANAGKALTWKCGQDALTTIAARYLPSSCK